MAPLKRRQSDGGLLDMRLSLGSVLNLLATLLGGAWVLFGALGALDKKIDTGIVQIQAIKAELNTFQSRIDGTVTVITSRIDRLVDSK